MTNPDILLPETTPWAVGIGRSADPAFMEIFSETFEAVMPAGVSFIPREIAGVNYVSANRFTGLIERSTITIEQSRVASLAQQIVASLCEREKLNPTALEGVDASIINLLYKYNDGDRRADLSLAIEDLPEAFYPSGYLMVGEKVTTLQALHQFPASRPKSGKPKSLLKLGFMAGEPALVRDSLSRAGSLREALSGRAALGSVGIVTSS